MNRFARHHDRGGVTLIELLIVVSILVLLMAYATSMIKPTLEDRKNREAAQLVNTYFTAAQARAAEKGRPEGVWLQRSANDDNKVLQMFAATSPPPFMGSLTTSRVGNGYSLHDSTDPWAIDANNDSSIDSDRNNDGFPDDTNNDGNIDEGFDLDGNGTVDVGWLATVNLTTDGTNADILVSYPLVRPGDKIRFDFQGPYYRIVRVGAAAAVPGPFPRGVSNSTPPSPGTIHIAPIEEAAFRAPVVKSYQGLPFQIFRQPKKSIVASVEFPTSISLDLALSGFGSGGKELEADNSLDDQTPVVIMFRPTGGVDRVYYGNTSVRPVEPLHLLLGQYEYSYADRLLQINDDRNRWLTINHRSGDTSAVQVKIDENNPLTDLSATSIKASRTNALSARRGAAIGTGG